MKLPALPNFGTDKLSGHKSEAHWLCKLIKHAELQGRSEQEKLPLHLVGRVEQIHEVLPSESKSFYVKDTKALGDRLKLVGRKALFMNPTCAIKALSYRQHAQLLQNPGELVDKFMQAFENLFAKSYGAVVGK